MDEHYVDQVRLLLRVLPMEACFVQVWGSHRDTGVEFGFIQGVQSAEGRDRLIAGVELVSERDWCEKVWPRRVGIVRVAGGVV